MQFQEFLNSLGYDAVFFTQPVYMTLNRLSMGQRGLRQAVRCMMYEGSNAHVTSLTDVHASSNLPFRCLDLDWMSDLLTGVSATFPRYFKYGKNFVIKLPQNGDIHISFQTIQGK